MEIKDPKTAYNAPQAKVLEVNVQGGLCQSGGTEKCGMSGYSYDDADWD